MNKEIVEKAANYIEDIFAKKLPQWAVYHNINHTKATVAACREIGSGSNLNETDLEIVILSGWFHDSGHLEGRLDHEERSVKRAQKFLRENGYPEERIAKVAGCIRATQLPQHPDNLLEQVVCDADFAHLGLNNFSETTQQIRRELEISNGHKFDDIEWLEINIDFLSRVKFHTAYARSTFGAQLMENLQVLRKQLQVAITCEER